MKNTGYKNRKIFSVGKKKRCLRAYVAMYQSSKVFNTCPDIFLCSAQ